MRAATAEERRERDGQIETAAGWCREVDAAVSRYRRRVERDDWPSWVELLPPDVRAEMGLE
jgi:hypothetical protein